jgi:hypothetical protein
LALSDKDFEAVTVKMLQQVMVNTLETNENTQSLRKETEGIETKQMQILELKNTITKRGKSLDRLSSRMDIIEEARNGK